MLSEINGSVFPSEPLDVSPYDDSFPMYLFVDGLKRKVEEAEQTAKRIYTEVLNDAPVVLRAKQMLEKGVRYVADLSPEMIKDIESGAIKLVQENGKTYAQLLDEHHHYSTKIPLKQEIFGMGNPVAMMNALQMKAIQEQLQNITDQLTGIDQNVRSVLEGQQNDRIGLYHSGVSLYLESRAARDNDLKLALTVQALRALSEATFQLSLVMQSDIRYLLQGEYKRERKKQVELIDEHMKSINQCFGVIHQAMMMRAAIYCERGEVASMTAVLGDYSNFIENAIAKNAPLLAQCDVRYDGTASGIWNSRAKLALDVSEIKQQLMHSENAVYLSLEGASTDEAD